MCSFLCYNELGDNYGQMGKILNRNKSKKL